MYIIKLFEKENIPFVYELMSEPNNLSSLHTSVIPLDEWQKLFAEPKDADVLRRFIRSVEFKFMKTNGLNWTFDTVAKTYEKLRPGYVDELYQTIFEYKPINSTSSVVEIGIGGGQATLPFLQSGCNLTAIDYGENFCKICREKFKEFPKFSAVSGKFEDIDFNCEYDLIYSASAFHWIPEEIGYKKVYDMLKDGGVFARFANYPYRY